MIPLSVQAGLWGLLSGSALLIGAADSLVRGHAAQSRRADHGIRLGRADLGAVVRTHGRALEAGGILGGRDRLPCWRGGVHGRQRGAGRARPAPPPEFLHRSLSAPACLLAERSAGSRWPQCSCDLPEDLSISPGVRKEGKTATYTFTLWTGIALSIALSSSAGYTLLDALCHRSWPPFGALPTVPSGR